MKPILCTECKKEIKYRTDLKVAGKLLQPYHETCLANPDSKLGKLHKFTGCFPMGVKFWTLIIIGNLFLGFVYLNNSESAVILILFTLIFNAVFILARLGIYLGYEKHLE